MIGLYRPVFELDFGVGERELMLLEAGAAGRNVEWDDGHVAARIGPASAAVYDPIAEFCELSAAVKHFVRKHTGGRVIGVRIQEARCEYQVGLGAIEHSLEILFETVVGDEFLDAAVRIAEEVQPVGCHAQNTRRGTGFGHPFPGEVVHLLDGPEQSLLGEEHGESRAIAAGDPHDADVTPGLDDAADRPGATQRFIVGMRRDDQ